MTTAESGAIRTALVACVSSAITAILILLLIREGHDNMVSTVVDRVRVSATGPKCDCSVKEWRDSISPQQFVRDPWQRPIYDRNETGDGGWWSSLLTPNGGFFVVQGEHERETQEYGVSMFHQLHCLTILRSMMLYGEMGYGEHMHTSRDSTEDAEDQDHWLHCFDYIVQAILCTADDTLEPEGKVKGPGSEVVDGVSGLGGIHQCRNATQVYDRVLQSEKVPIKASSIKISDGRMSILS